jgi:hypothetical protein
MDDKNDIQEPADSFGKVVKAEFEIMNLYEQLVLLL